jgi:glycosyltransferase involved in cell wall biosynthesis
MVDPEEVQYVPEMRRYCRAVETYVRPRALDSLRLARGLFWGPPGSAAKYWDAGFGRLVGECVGRYGIDLVEFQHLNTAAYRDQAGSVPAILREHNVEYKVWERHAVHARSLVESLYVRRYAPRVRAYEGKMAPRFARCLTVSRADARHLTEIAPTARLEVIPSGVDTEYFYPSPDVQEEPHRMVLTGSFEWKPKHHNLRVLLAEIVPRIRAKVPEAKLYVVGKGVPEELRRLAERTPGVTVTGTVPDVRPYVWRSSLVLNYLESGGGIALKVLEAMAMRRPVLSNSLGCEGIEVEHGREVFLADGAEEFAGAAAHLLEDAAVRRSLAEKGYQRVPELYSWAIIANRLQDCYETVVAEHSGATAVQTSAERASASVATGAN